MSDAPRVIFVNRVYWPSAAATAQLLTDLAEGLAMRGWNVHVVASGDGSTVRNGVTIHRTGPAKAHLGMFSRAGDYRHFRKSACKLLTGLLQSADLVVPMTDPPLLGTAVATTAAKHGVRVVHWIQDIYPEIASTHFGSLAGFFFTFFKSRRNTAWREAAACVTLGEDMAGMVLDQGVEETQVMVIPNWAPRELHTPAPDTEVAAHRRDRWQLQDKFVVVYSGNLGRVHEFATILAVADKLRDEPRVIFLFIGSGAHFEEIAATARERKLSNIRMLGPEPRATLATSLRAADAHLVTLKPAYASLVYPSKLSGVLAAGRPVLFIGPEKGEIANLIRKHACGLSFATDASTELANHIQLLATDPALRHAQADRARGLYDKLFTADIALRRWDELLHRLTRPGISSVASTPAITPNPPL